MTEDTFSMPVIYLGQSSRSVGAEIDKLNHMLGGIIGPNSTYVNDEITPGRANDSNTFRMQKCAHTLTERTEYCSVCSANAEMLQDVVMRRLLERSGSTSCGHQICVVSDNYTQFGTWSSSLVREYLQQETSFTKNSNGGDAVHNTASSGGVMSVLVKPPLGCSRGLECLYSVLSTQHSLDTSHATLFRGLEACHNHSSGVPQYNTVHNIACDLYPILCATDSITTSACGYTSGDKGKVSSIASVHTLQSYIDNTTIPYDMQYHMWPLDIVRTNSKIIDTRSSLSALLKKLLKTAGSNKNVEYNALRSVAANIHAMHLAYTDTYASNTHIVNNMQGMCVTSANYAQLMLPTMIRTIPTNTNTVINTLYPNSHTRKCMAFSNVLHTEHELYVSFTHATPGITWPYRNNTKNSLHVNGTGGTSGAGGNMSGTSGASVSSDSSTVLGGLSSRPSTTQSVHSTHSTHTTSTTYTNTARTKTAHKQELHPYNAVNTGSRANAHTTHSLHNCTDETDNVSVMSMGSAKGPSRLSNKSSGGRSGTGFSCSGNASAYGRSVYTGASGVSGVSGIGEGIGDGKDYAIGSIVFDSPYGVMDCTHICDSARDLLNNGAYRHLFGPTGSAFTSEELYDAIDLIESYYLS